MNVVLHMQSAMKAGLAYFAIVFAVGFMVGTLRVLVLLPYLGEVLAVIVELPFMLAVSWIVCKWLVVRFSVAGRPAPRLAMGGTAFALLMVAEICVSLFGFKRTITEHFEVYQEVGSIIGLLGQVAFALFPVIRLIIPSAQLERN